MAIKNTLIAAFVAAACCSAAATTNTTLPSLNVPACPSKAYLRYDLSSPEQVAFPDTAAEVCYDDSSLHIDFLAYNETSFFYNSTYTTNGDIYNYEVMEVFIAKGTSDPQTYLEFEVAPNNVTFQVRKEHIFCWRLLNLEATSEKRKVKNTLGTRLANPIPLVSRPSSTIPLSTGQTARPLTHS